MFITRQLVWNFSLTLTHSTQHSQNSQTQNKNLGVFASKTFNLCLTILWTLTILGFKQ